MLKHRQNGHQVLVIAIMLVCWRDTCNSGGVSQAPQTSAASADLPFILIASLDASHTGPKGLSVKLRVEWQRKPVNGWLFVPRHAKIPENSSTSPLVFPEMAPDGVSSDRGCF